MYLDLGGLIVVSSVVFDGMVIGVGGKFFILYVLYGVYVVKFLCLILLLKFVFIL